MIGLWRRILMGCVSVATFVGGSAVFADGGLPVAPATTPPSASAPTVLGTVSPDRPILGYHGSLGNTTPLPVVNNPDPVVCAMYCRELTFTDDTPHVPVLVSVKSTITGPNGSFADDDGYDLYVYGPTRQLVGDANGIGSNGQAVAFTPSVKGVYTVVLTATYAYDEDAHYVGQVRLMAGQTWRPAEPTCGIRVGGRTGCFDLPRLRALPPYDLDTTGIPPMASTPLGFPFPFTIPTPTSCYADETVGLDNTTLTNANDPVLRCLRFTTDVQNIGSGLLTASLSLVGTDAKGNPQTGYVPGGCKATQTVQMADGGTVNRSAGNCEFHVEHGHFHYSGLLTYGLFKAGRHGQPTGRVIGSSKASFCLTDDDYFGYGSSRVNGPRNYVGQPDCNVPRQVAAPAPGTPDSGTFISEGMTPGWGDVYTWDTPGQLIDVTHVKSGVYDLVEETNPAGHILVAGPTRTCSMTRLRLTVGSTTDIVRTLASVLSIPCPLMRGA